jgi:hypothetical protein
LEAALSDGEPGAFQQFGLAPSGVVGWPIRSKRGDDRQSLRGFGAIKLQQVRARRRTEHPRRRGQVSPFFVVVEMDAADGAVERRLSPEPELPVTRCPTILYAIFAHTGQRHALSLSAQRGPALQRPNIRLLYEARRADDQPRRHLTCPDAPPSV